ncbi:expressed protein, partial [Phakopsora pachyrhizi]
NSALGLYEGELEPGHRDNTLSSEGEDQFDDEDAEMDDLDEGAMLGSDLSDASDEDGDVIAESGVIRIPRREIMMTMMMKMMRMAITMRTMKMKIMKMIMIMIMMITMFTTLI